MLPRQGNEDDAGDKSIIFNVCISVELVVGWRSSWAKALLETGRSSRGVVDIDGFVELFCAACFSGAAWLGLLACLLG